MRTEIEEAADLLFPADGSRRTLNVKFSFVGPGVSAEDLARQIIHADNEIASGRSVPVTDIDL